LHFFIFTPLQDAETQLVSEKIVFAGDISVGSYWNPLLLNTRVIVRDVHSWPATLDGARVSAPDCW